MKAQRPQRRLIFDHWYPILSEMREYKHLDFSDPFCWVCKEYIHHGITTKRTWEDGKLQRHHIVPEALEGSHDLNNFFLMCKRCHALAPTVNDKEMFLKWARGMSNGLIEEFQFRMHASALCPIPYFERRFVKWAYGLDEDSLRKVMQESVELSVQHWGGGEGGTSFPRSNFAILMYRKWTAEYEAGVDLQLGENIADVYGK